MRVIAGRSRGRKLLAPTGLDVRPTADRMKEALFNMLGNRVQDSKLLDLFAGSGAIGIEALSRGASFAAFADLDARLARKNIKACGYDASSLVLEMDWRLAARRLKALEKKFDIVFLDPPYRQGLCPEAAAFAKEQGLLAEGGLVVAECASDELKEVKALIEANLGLAAAKEKSYTTAAFLFFDLG
jgi:16S rRNA (guanine(966)-N(2))-methyltransferase RsmD